MKRRKINKKFIIIVLILFISIGFAYLSASLNITGLATIKRSVWDVHFENIVNENENVLTINTPAQITNNKLRIDFEVSLDQPGEEYSFYVDVLNNSTFDVALDTLTVSGLTSTQEQWIIPTVTYSDGISPLHNDILKENSLETLRVSVKYNDDLTSNNLPTIDNDFTLTVELKYNQADSNSKERTHLEYVNRQTPGVISVGDEISVGTEHFYVVSSNEEKTVLLAKYNLNVGNNIQDGEVGIQNENSIGNGGNQSGIYYASTVPFSTNTYWYNNGLNNQYDTSFTDNNIYDETYSESTGNNYSIAYYVKNYRQKLNEIGLNNIKSRLLLYNEVIDLGCEYSDVRTSCLVYGPLFLKMTSFWLGTASNQSRIWYIDARAYFNTINSNDDHNLGVRPVIELDTDYLLGNITVSFDPNGGEVTPNTKLVRLGTTYDTLPTPTKPGYTFVGWNGKNHFNPIDFYENGKDYQVFIDGNDIILATYAYQENVTRLHVNCKENTQHTLSYDWNVVSIGSGSSISSGLNLFYKDGTSYSQLLSLVNGQQGDSGHKVIVSDENKSIFSVASSGWMYYGRIRFSSIQLEEGTTATPYEPYYITNDTTVVQNKSHTLKALWEPSKFDLTIDPNGGTFNESYTVGTTVREIANRTSPLTLNPKLIYSKDNWRNIGGVMPTRSGYTLEGFYDINGVKVYEANGYAVSDTIYFEGDTHGNNSKYIYPNNLTVIAHWTQN